MILITGGLGFIGAHTALALLNAGEEVVLSRHRNFEVPTYLRRQKGVALHDFDTTSREEWAVLGHRYAFTGIVHLASSPISTGQFSLVSSSIKAFINAIEAATRWQARLIFASTIGVYGGASATSPYSESVDLNLVQPYGIPGSKKVMEILAAVATAERGIDAVGVRLPAI